MSRQTPEARRRYRAENKEKVLAQQRRHYAKHQEALSARRRELYAQNAATVIAQQKKRLSEETEEQRERRRAQRRETRRKYARLYAQRQKGIPLTPEQQEKKKQQKREKNARFMQNETRSPPKRAYVQEYKMAHPCACGEDDPCCLVFHHREPQEKSFNIAVAMGTRGYRIPLDDLIREVAKCDVLCANCHAKLHARKRAERRAAAS